jgi:hypothetical protein
MNCRRNQSGGELQDDFVNVDGSIPSSPLRSLYTSSHDLTGAFQGTVTVTAPTVLLTLSASA